MNPTFKKIGRAKVGRSVFNLSYDKKGTCDLGDLIPVCCDEMVPGDIFKVAVQAVIRFLPMVAPILHEINVYFHYFFVPYRILWNEKTNDETSDTGTWEEFITGGLDGADASSIPQWTGPTTTVGSLWDYFGFPVGITPTSRIPIDMPRRAYNLTLNEYYLDTQIDTPLGLEDEVIVKRRWEKDYFTSARPDQQLGTAPSLPLSGTTNADWSADVPLTWPNVISNTSHQMLGDVSNVPYNANTKADLEAGVVAEADADNNTVDFSGAGTFDVADLRSVFQIQRWQERNARAGARYTEFLGSHFGVNPRDERLDRPEYIGGCKMPVIVSEVLQTESSDASTPQATMAGHGVSANSKYIGKYRAKEFGLILGLMSIMPRSVYENGIDRQWQRTDKFDFYFPEFAHLSEQAVEQVEICASATGAINIQTFGYQGRYDEMRSKRSMVVGELREGESFEHWHLSRHLTNPVLNSTFLACDPRKDFLAVPSDPAVIFNIANIIKAIRPLPFIADPGYVDH